MNNFRRIREALNLSQAAIGKELGVTQGNVSFYEQGQTVPPPIAAKLIEVAKARDLLITFDHVYSAKPPKLEKRPAPRRPTARAE